MIPIIGLLFFISLPAFGVHFFLFKFLFEKDRESFYFALNPGTLFLLFTICIPLTVIAFYCGLIIPIEQRAIQFMMIIKEHKDPVLHGWVYGIGRMLGIKLDIDYNKEENENEDFSNDG